MMLVDRSADPIYEAMRSDQDMRRLADGRLRVGGQLSKWLGMLAAITVGAAALVVGLFFSVVVLTVGLSLGLIGYGVLRWKLRGWRRRLQEAAQQARAGQGEIIEVQVREIDERRR